jgi:hypothetical protein
MNLIALTPLLLTAIFIIGCGEEEKKENDLTTKVTTPTVQEKNSTQEVPTQKIPDTQINSEPTMTFSRISMPSLDTIKVNVSLKSDTTSLSPTVNHGQLTNVTRHSPRQYSFEIIPDITGEYKINISHNQNTYKRTALVLQDVDDEWEQPLMVEGFVNTEGYEDGVTITPDGEYIFVQTGPYRLSSVFVFAESRDKGGCGGHRLIPSKCEHPWVNKLIGTYTAPKRPNFFDGRFSGENYLNNSHSWGLKENETPNFALSTMFYGFKKQSDGSFKEPFYMAFDDLNDAISGPFGLSFLKLSDKKYSTIFSLKDISTTDFGFDVYQYNAIFEENNILGHYEKSGNGNPPNRTQNFASKAINFGNNSGTQGNPFLYAKNSKVLSIWSDNEYDSLCDENSDRNKISVQVLNSGEYITSSDWTKVVLPTNVNNTNSESRQPTFVNNRLYFTQNINIVTSTFNAEHTATNLANNSNWTKSKIILQKDTTITAIQADIGKIFVVGEPTIAIVDSKEILYFVYGYIRGIDPLTGILDVETQAGYIRHR